MMKHARIVLPAILIALSACNNPVDQFEDNRINDYNSLIEEFKDPGIDYRPAPLWVWNNDVSSEDIDFSLAELKDKGMGGVFIHPRRGLITEYLSDKWFDLVGYSMEKAKEIGLNVWLYDENVCPSGFAGGHVYNEMPESYNQGTVLNVHIIQSQPYTRNIKLEAGQNEVSVVVYGSLKNIFGPHHVYARGYMRPPAFRKGKEIMPPGEEYDVLDYGLFKEFEVYNLK